MRRLRLEPERREEGMTLVEVSVALVILSVILAAFGAFLMTAVSVQRSNEYRTKATQVGTQILEEYRALPWSKLGYYADDTAAGTNCTASPLVTIPVPATKDAQVPTGTVKQVTHGNITYDAQACTYWHDDPSDGLAPTDTDPQDAKRIQVEVSWANAGEPKTLTVSGLRAPTAQEVTPKSASATTPIGVLTAVATPASATIDAAGLTTAPITIAATTTVGISVVQLRWSDSTGTDQFASMSVGSDSTLWNYTLPTGSGPFAATSTVFTVSASSPTGEQNSQAVTVAFSTAASSLTIPTLTASANSIDVTSVGTITTAFTINATASAPVSSMSVTYTTRAGDVATRIMTVSGSSGSITFAAGDGPFPDTSVDFVVTANSANGSASRAISVTFVPPHVIPVEVTKIDVTPALCLKTNGNKQEVFRASTVTIQVSGIGESDAVTLEFNDANHTKVEAMPTATPIEGGAEFGYTVPDTWSWSGNEFVVTALATRLSDNTQSPVTAANPTPIVYVNNEGQCG